MDAGDHVPYLPAAKLLRRLRDERPQLREFFVPCANGRFQRIYDPVVVDKFHLLISRLGWGKDCIRW